MQADLTRDVVLGYSDVSVIDSTQMPELGLAGNDGEPLKLLVWTRVEQRSGLPPKVEQLVLAMDVKVQRAIMEGIAGGIEIPKIQLPGALAGNGHR